MVFRAAAEPAPRYAFLGVRPCDLTAVQVLDRVDTDLTEAATRMSRAMPEVGMTAVVIGVVPAVAERIGQLGLLAGRVVVTDG